MLNQASSSPFAVIGAGPYGLAVASHLRAAGMEVRIFGKPMDFWDSQMPKGMRLRSPWTGSHIADPAEALTLDHYEKGLGRSLPRGLPLEDFVRYGQWFQRQALPDLDPSLVVQVERVDSGFRLTLDSGEHVSAGSVVVATGIGAFPRNPTVFAELPRELASHVCDRANRDLERFAGKRVVVIGGGQSAIESAAILDESGAEVKVLVRQPRIRWLKSDSFLEWMMDSRINPFQAPGKIGPIGMNWLIEHPRLFTLAPRSLQDRMTKRAIRPAGSSWLRPRTQRVTFTTGQEVRSAAAHGERVRLTLHDGKQVEADHVLLGTGYQIDLARYSFLAPQLVQTVATANGYPILNAGFESSVAGLYFVGTTAAHSFGPLCRFVAGTPFTARTLSQYVTGKLRAPRSLTVVALSSREHA